MMSTSARAAMLGRYTRTEISGSGTPRPLLPAPVLPPHGPAGPSCAPWSFEHHTQRIHQEVLLLSAEFLCTVISRRGLLDTILTSSEYCSVSYPTRTNMLTFIIPSEYVTYRVGLRVL
jgi:hypothetical protein